MKWKMSKTKMVTSMIVVLVMILVSLYYSNEPVWYQITLVLIWIPIVMMTTSVAVAGVSKLLSKRATNIKENGNED
jgi:phosphatidylglycerophosphate synthase